MDAYVNRKAIPSLTSEHGSGGKSQATYEWLSISPMIGFK